MTDLLGKCGLPVWEEEPQGDDVGLVIRNVSAELKSYGGFAWPESGYVEAPDWRDSATCGNGLHGLLDGIGEWSLLSDAHDARWQIVKVARSEVVRIDDAKVKFPRGWVVFTGGSAAAKKFILPAMVASVFKGAEGNTATGYKGHAVATGDRGIAASLGIYARAKAAKDGAIMLAEWVHDGQRWTIASVFASKVGENGIEPDVWYELKDGKPVKVTEQSE